MKHWFFIIFFSILSFMFAFWVPIQPSTPWKSIGGCGAGGSGGGASDGIQWIGQGVSGGRINSEIFVKKSVGQNFSSFSFSPHFSMRPLWHTELGISIPFSSYQGEVQYRSNQVPVDKSTGGLGDLSLDFSRIVGTTGDASISLSFTLPTGQYDIKRGSDASLEFLPGSFQKGSGLYSLSLGFDYTKDTDMGMWLYNISYSHPFAMRLWSGENEFNKTYFKNIETDNDKRFHYRFKHYGENDLGAYTPPAINTSLAYGYRGQRGFVHSFGLHFSAPLGVAWISSEKTDSYDPRPDPDHQTWSASLVYGLEFSRSDYPLYFAVSLPLHSKTGESNPDNEYDPSPMKVWRAPDFEDFLQQWTLGFGIKASFF